MGLVSFIAALAALAPACHSDENGPCVSSADCRLGAYCNGGACMTPAAPEAGDDDADSTDDVDQSMADGSDEASGDDAAAPDGGDI